MARAPVLAKEMRGVSVKGFVELYERRDKAKARITLRVIALGDLPAAETPHRVRVTLSAANAHVDSGGSGLAEGHAQAAARTDLAEWLRLWTQGLV